ncbi:hypothetical protein B0H14DRAFT_2590839 [Mycena olivaceomarginata]|nr:hypothetical protein B0H14DRAFT_2590839 [Mycena olivaceomarginata]
MQFCLNGTDVDVTLPARTSSSPGSRPPHQRGPKEPAVTQSAHYPLLPSPRVASTIPNPRLIQFKAGQPFYTPSLLLPVPPRSMDYADFFPLQHNFEPAPPYAEQDPYPIPAYEDPTAYQASGQLPPAPAPAPAPGQNQAATENVANKEIAPADTAQDDAAASLQAAQQADAGVLSIYATFFIPGDVSRPAPMLFASSPPHMSSRKRSNRTTYRIRKRLRSAWARLAAATRPQDILTLTTRTYSLGPSPLVRRYNCVPTRSTRPRFVYLYACLRTRMHLHLAPFLPKPAYLRARQEVARTSLPSLNNRTEFRMRAPQLTNFVHNVP